MFRKKNIDDLSLDDILLPNWQIFMFLAIINFLISFWAHRLIFTKELYYALLSDQLELTRIDNFVDILKKYSFMGTLVIPIVLFLQYLVTGLLLQIPLLLNYIEIGFRKLFRIVMLSSVVLTAGQVVHFIRIYFTPLENVTEQSLMVKPLSMATLVQVSAYPPSSLYVLNQCNLFELLWVGCIFYGLLRTNHIKISDAALLSFVVWSMILFLHWMIYFFIGKLQ